MHGLVYASKGYMLCGVWLSVVLDVVGVAFCGFGCGGCGFHRVWCVVLVLLLLLQGLVGMSGLGVLYWYCCRFHFSMGSEQPDVTGFVIPPWANYI